MQIRATNNDLSSTSSTPPPSSTSPGASTRFARLASFSRRAASNRSDSKITILPESSHRNTTSTRVTQIYDEEK